MARNIYEEILRGRVHDDPPAVSGSTVPDDDGIGIDGGNIGSATVGATRNRKPLSFTGQVSIPTNPNIPEDAVERLLGSGEQQPAHAPSMRLSWGDIWNKLNPVENEEERRKRLRRERSRLIWNSVGDGIAAIANLAGTSAGAPDIGTPKLTARQQQRLDAELAERKKNRESHINGYIRSLQQERADEIKDARESRLQEQHRLNVRRQEWKEQQDEERFDYYKEKLRIEEEYKKGLLSLREKEMALRELDVYNRVYGTTYKSRSVKSPKGVTVTNESTVRNPGVLRTAAVNSYVLQTQPSSDGTISQAEADAGQMMPGSGDTSQSSNTGRGKKPGNPTGNSRSGSRVNSTGGYKKGGVIKQPNMPPGMKKMRKRGW